MKWMLVWAVMTIGPQGSFSAKVPETTKFASEKACEVFAHDMTPRMEDWVRGRLKAEWEHPVQITYTCGPDGLPA